MKRILLASTAIVAFAGAAAAQDSNIGISFTGSAELGFNDTNTGDNDGFYSELEITIGLVAELDNGLTAAASVDFEDLSDGESADGNTAEDETSDVNFELSLTNSDGGLFYGDTNFAAQNLWVSAGSMNSDDFSEADGEEAIRAEYTINGWTAQVSGVISDANGRQVEDDEIDQLSLAVAGDVGTFNIVAAYQAESDGDPAGDVDDDGNPVSFLENANGDFVDDEIFGLSVSTNFSGASVRLAYASNETANEDSIAVEVSYPFGPVTATGFYSLEDDADDDNFGINLAYEEGPVSITFDYESNDDEDEYGLEGAYDVGNGLVLFAGYVLEEDENDDNEAYYIAGEYDLGSGAELIVSYAEDDSENDDFTFDDEIGAQEYQDGTTVEISFEF